MQSSLHTSSKLSYSTVQYSEKNDALEAQSGASTSTLGFSAVRPVRPDRGHPQTICGPIRTHVLNNTEQRNGNMVGTWR